MEYKALTAHKHSHGHGHAHDHGDDCINPTTFKRICFKDSVKEKKFH